MRGEPRERHPHCDSKTVNVNGGPVVGCLTRLEPLGRLVGMTWKRIALLVGLVVVVGVTVGLVRTQVAAACTVTVAERTVDLDAREAEAASVAVAAVVARSGSADEARSAVSTSVDLGPADVRVVAAALSGRERAALVCRHGGAESEESDELSADGLTARAQQVHADIRARFGDVPLGGFAPGGVSSGHMRGSAHYDGRAVDAFFRPVTEANKARGWALSHYLVAHAERLAIDTVIFDGRIWTARRAFQGWRDYDIEPNGRSKSVVSILEHRDHVHVDVAD